MSAAVLVDRSMSSSCRGRGAATIGGDERGGGGDRIARLLDAEPVPPKGWMLSVRAVRRGALNFVGLIVVAKVIEDGDNPGRKGHEEADSGVGGRSC